MSHTTPRMMASRPQSYAHRMLVPNRHVNGQGHHRSPQRASK
ncbi:hypothetical protein [Vibrio nitrifigilis]|nr:hypothetical protein [Vibrio nitrifigilis]